jgi:transcriptional regulator with XRE-family HTH domain
METAQAPESFRGLLLLHRRRTGLTQRDLAVRAGVSLGSIQDWETGITLPTAERLQRLIRALLEALLRSRSARTTCSAVSRT